MGMMKCSTPQTYLTTESFWCNTYYPPRNIFQKNAPPGLLMIEKLYSVPLHVLPLAGWLCYSSLLEKSLFLSLKCLLKFKGMRTFPLGPSLLPGNICHFFFLPTIVTTFSMLYYNYLLFCLP